jgi:hypothetical protein
MFFITVETKALKFMISKAFCVRQLGMTFSSILILMNFCLLELEVEEAATHGGVNGRVTAKKRYFFF